MRVQCSKRESRLTSCLTICAGSSATRSDEGGWVDIDAVITDYHTDIFPPNTSKSDRYMAIVEVMKWQDSGYRKSRFQILAVKFPSIMNPNITRAVKQELLEMGRTMDESMRYSVGSDGAGPGVFVPQLATSILDS